MELSPHERCELAVIEKYLSQEDPELVRTMKAWPGPAGCEAPWSRLWLAAAGVLTSVAALAAGVALTSGTFLILLVTVAAVGLVASSATAATMLRSRRLGSASDAHRTSSRSGTDRWSWLAAYGPFGWY
jgi:hypothetical protein